MADAEEDLDDVVAREKRFWDTRGTRYEIARNLIGRAIGGFSSYGELDRLYDPAGLDILDYGCGRGADAIALVQRGAAHVTGFDVSEAEIAHAREAAAAAGVADRTTFLVADAHATGFPDASFDLVRGNSVLHHLDLEPALRELARILRPGARAVFVEPLAHNPLLRAGRAVTPMARTEDEHPFTVDDWATCAAVFPGFEHFERELITVPLMPLNLVLPARGRAALAQRVKAADVRVIRRAPRLRRYARLTFLILQ